MKTKQKTPRKKKKKEIKNPKEKESLTIVKQLKNPSKTKKLIINENSFRPLIRISNEDSSPTLERIATAPEPITFQETTKPSRENNEKRNEIINYSPTSQTGYSAISQNPNGQETRYDPTRTLPVLRDRNEGTNVQLRNPTPGRNFEQGEAWLRRIEPESVSRKSNLPFEEDTRKYKEVDIKKYKDAGY